MKKKTLIKLYKIKMILIAALLRVMTLVYLYFIIYNNNNQII